LKRNANDRQAHCHLFGPGTFYQYSRLRNSKVMGNCVGVPRIYGSVDDRE